MKKLLFICTAVVMLVACGIISNKESSVIFSGELKNSDATKVRILNEFTRIDIDVDSNGNFKQELNIKAGKYFVVDNSKESVYFFMYIPESGEVGFTVDAGSFLKNRTTEFLQFFGEGKIFNEYLLTIERPISAILLGDLLGNEILLKEKDEFIRAVDIVIDSAKQAVENYPNLSEKLKALELKDIEYNKYECLTLYKPYRYYSDNDEVSASLPADMRIEEVMSSIGLSNEDDFNFSLSYRKLIKFYLEVSFKRGSDTDFIKFVGKKITNKYILNQIIYNKIKSNFFYSEDPKAYYEAYISLATNAKQKEEITKLYESIKSLLPGNPSPKFTNYENHAGGTSSLSDFEGKYVYIDVWATWCSPCIAEIPSFKKLKQDYKGKNIEFMSISIDAKKDYDKWKNMVTQKKLKGTQLIADKEFDSKFIKDYRINGIPRFILIDPKGNIVNYNAPRPSDARVKQLLDSLL